MTKLTVAFRNFGNAPKNRTAGGISFFTQCGSLHALKMARACRNMWSNNFMIVLCPSWCICRWIRWPIYDRQHLGALRRKKPLSFTCSPQRRRQVVWRSLGQTATNEMHVISMALSKDSTRGNMNTKWQGSFWHATLKIRHYGAIYCELLQQAVEHIPNYDCRATVQDVS